MTSRPSQHDGEREAAGHLTDDELSAFINGDLDESSERDRIQAHLDECAECRERLSELRTVVALLHRVESPAPSRSFRLTPEMVRPEPVEIDSWIARVQPAMRRLTAIAAALLLVIVVADALAHSGTSGSVGSKSAGVTFSTSTSSASGASQSLAVAPAATAAATSASRDTASSGSAESQAVTSAENAATATPAAAQGIGVSPSQSVPPAVASQPSKAHTSYWRLSELAAGVVVMWLLFVTIALPRLHARRKA